MFGLGVGAFMDALFNYGEIFRQVNSVLFMLVALALLVRGATKRRFGMREEFAKRVAEKERELYLLQSGMSRTIVTDETRTVSSAPKATSFSGSPIS